MAWHWSRTFSLALGPARTGDVQEVELGLVRAAAGVTPELGWRGLDLRLPVGVGHDETTTGTFRESRGRLRLEAEGRLFESLKVEGGIGVQGVWRPGWPDPYKPLPDGSLGRTRRHSFWARDLDVEVRGRSGSLHASLGYEARVADYLEDRDFEPVDAPLHLTPADGRMQRMELEVAHARRGLRSELALEVSRHESFYSFARDAGTGVTHTAPGGAPPNPLQTLERLTPRARTRWRLSPNAKVVAGYELAFTRDVYEGYYSSVAHRPSAGAVIRMGEAEVSLRLEASWLRYGRDSYAAGPSHPALDEGVRREDRRGAFDLEVTRPLGGSWSWFVDGHALVRRTNYPDYQPGIFPAGRRYAVRWDYEAYRLLVGATWSVGPAR